MATHTDSNKLQNYQPGNTPALGDQQRYISNELAKISQAIGNILVVMKLYETRMNTNGLT